MSEHKQHYLNEFHEKNSKNCLLDQENVKKKKCGKINLRRKSEACITKEISMCMVPIIEVWII